jgi:hypothetical protein
LPISKSSIVYKLAIVSHFLSLFSYSVSLSVLADKIKSPRRKSQNMDRFFCDLNHIVLKATRRLRRVNSGFLLQFILFFY